MRAPTTGGGARARRVRSTLEAEFGSRIRRRDRHRDGARSALEHHGSFGAPACGWPAVVSRQRSCRERCQRGMHRRGARMSDRAPASRRARAGAPPGRRSRAAPRRPRSPPRRRARAGAGAGAVPAGAAGAGSTTRSGGAGSPSSSSSSITRYTATGRRRITLGSRSPLHVLPTCCVDPGQGRRYSAGGGGPSIGRGQSRRARTTFSATP